MAEPAKATNGRDFDPISSSCRNSSWNSNGGVTAAHTTCQKKVPRSPNHSKNLASTPLEEFTVRDTKTGRPWETTPAIAVDFWSITDRTLNLRLRVHRGDACDKFMRAVHHK